MPKKGFTLKIFGKELFSYNRGSSIEPLFSEAHREARDSKYLIDFIFRRGFDPEWGDDSIFLERVSSGKRGRGRPKKEENKKLEQLRYDYGMAIRDVRSLYHSPGERIYIENRNLKDAQSRILRRDADHATNKGDKKMSDNKYFQYNDHCVKHNKYECDDCRRAARISQQGTLMKIETAEVATNNRLALADKLARIESFESSVSFVKEALNYDDKRMAKVKITDIPKLMAQAENEMTVGKMEKFITKEKRKIGVIGRTILQFFTRPK